VVSPEGIPEPQLDNEVEILTRFYATIGVKLGLWDRGSKRLRECASSHPTYQANLEALRELFRRGWTSEEILLKISQLAKAGVKAALLSSVIYGDPPQAGQSYDPDRELLQDGKPYYHRALKHIVSPEYRREPNGSWVCVKEPRIQLRDSFTLGDLINYYREQLGTPIGWQSKRLGLALQWMLSRGIELDEILFAIDEAAYSGGREKSLSPFDLIRFDYVSRAKEHLMELKRNDRNQDRR
jgi:hypothetical protein